MRILLAAMLLSVPALASAQSAERWSHAQSGISLPMTFGDMRVSDVKDRLGDGNDVMFQLGAEPEPVTVYVYRSPYPNAALWFERTWAAMQVNIPGLAGTASSPTTFALGGGALGGGALGGGALGGGAPNGLRQSVALPDGLRYKTTGIAFAQMGEWLVKLRVTSGTLDTAGVDRRLDEVMRALTLPPVTNAPNPLITPAACDTPLKARGKRIVRNMEDETAPAMIEGLLVYTGARGISGLAARPGDYCRATTKLPAAVASLFQARNGGEWVLLLGDAGLSMTSRTFQLPQVPGHKAKAKAGLYANSVKDTQLIAIYDELPDPEASLAVGMPVVLGRAPGIAAISTESADKPVSAPSPTTR